MRKIENWDELKATTDEVVSFDNLPIGPQYCKILDAKDNNEQQYLSIYFDIVKGDFKDVFKEQEERFGNWPSQGIKRQYYTTKSEKFFAGFITALEKSNDGFIFNQNLDWANQVKGKYFVGNFAEEEYLDGDEVKVSLKVREVRSIQAMKEGKVKELPRKCLPEDAKPVIQNKKDDGDGLPF